MPGMPASAAVLTVMAVLEVVCSGMNRHFQAGKWAVLSRSGAF